eukprot:884215-Prorocentrum_minimum.AAC.2
MSAHFSMRHVPQTGTNPRTRYSIFLERKPIVRLALENHRRCGKKRRRARPDTQSPQHGNTDRDASL